MAQKHCINCENKDSYNNFIPNPTPHFFSEIPINPSGNITSAPIMTESKENIQQAAVSNQDNFVIAPGSPTMLGPEYTQGYLRTIIGKKILVTFLIGTDSETDRSGILEAVGISYIILKETETGNKVLCDIYSIKFVTIFQ